MDRRLWSAESTNLTSWITKRMVCRRMILCFFVLFSTAGWSSVLVRWTQTDLPPARDLGISDLVVSWDGKTSSFVKAADRKGYRVYAEVPLQQAATAAESASGEVAWQVSFWTLPTRIVPQPRVRFSSYVPPTQNSDS